MQPSFWGTNPFLTGKRQKKSQNAEITLWLCRWEILLLALLLKCFMVQPSFVVSSYQDRSRKKNLLIFPSSPFCLLDSSSASCCFLFSALAACSLLILLS